LLQLISVIRKRRDKQSISLGALEYRVIFVAHPQNRTERPPELRTFLLALAISSWDNSAWRVIPTRSIADSKQKIAIAIIRHLQNRFSGTITSLL